MSNPEGLATGFTSGLYKFHWNTCIRLPLQSVEKISRVDRVLLEVLAGLWGTAGGWSDECPRLGTTAKGRKQQGYTGVIANNFEVSGWNPAPVFPEQTLHNLVLSLRGAAEHHHTKGLCLWRMKRSFLKQNYSAREGTSPTSATYLLNFALPGVRTPQLDHPRQPLKTSAIQEMYLWDLPSTDHKGFFRSLT